MICGLEKGGGIARHLLEEMFGELENPLLSSYSDSTKSTSIINNNNNNNRLLTRVLVKLLTTRRYHGLVEAVLKWKIGCN